MEGTQVLEFVVVAIVGIFGLGTIWSGFFQAHTAEAVVVQRMGKFERVAGAGINFKLPWLDQVAGRIDLGCRDWRWMWKRRPSTTFSSRSRRRCSIT